MFLIHGLIITKTEANYLCYDISLNGGPTSTFFEHVSTEKLTEGLTLLYSRLVDLGVEYGNGQIYLADFDERLSFT
jgi:hypothetical protein